MITKLFRKCHVVGDHSLFTELNKYLFAYLFMYVASAKFLCPYQKQLLCFSPFKQTPAKYSAIAKGIVNHVITISLPKLHSYVTGAGGPTLLIPVPHSFVSPLSGVLLASFANSYWQESSNRQFTVLGKMNWGQTG